MHIKKLYSASQYTYSQSFRNTYQQKSNPKANSYFSHSQPAKSIILQYQTSQESAKNHIGQQKNQKSTNLPNNKKIKPNKTKQLQKNNKYTFDVFIKQPKQAHMRKEPSQINQFERFSGKNKNGLNSSKRIMSEILSRIVQSGHTATNEKCKFVGDDSIKYKSISAGQFDKFDNLKRQQQLVNIERSNQKQLIKTSKTLQFIPQIDQKQLIKASKTLQFRPQRNRIKIAETQRNFEKPKGYFYDKIQQKIGPLNNQIYGKQQTGQNDCFLKIQRYSLQSKDCLFKNGSDFEALIIKKRLDKQNKIKLRQNIFTQLSRKHETYRHVSALRSDKRRNKHQIVETHLPQKQENQIEPW